MPRANPEPDDFLPLTPAVFHILLALADAERHGYAIMEHVAETTDGQIKMGPGTLYGTIKRLLGSALIEESDERPDPKMDDERRRYYRLTRLGRRVMEAEARRYASLVKLARAGGLLGCGAKLMSMTDENKLMRRAERFYQATLWLYPRDFRREFGPAMVQLFRDQYRAVGRCGKPAAGFWLRTFADLARSVSIEQLTHQTNRMKSMSPTKLSLILFAVAVGAGLFSCLFIPTLPKLAVGLAYLLSVAMLIRAVVEWKRPPTELVRGLIWAAVLAVFFALVLPVWGRFRLPVIMELIVIPILLNAVPPMAKAVVRVARPRS